MLLMRWRMGIYALYAKKGVGIVDFGQGQCFSSLNLDM